VASPSALNPQIGAQTPWSAARAGLLLQTTPQPWCLPHPRGSLVSVPGQSAALPSQRAALLALGDCFFVERTGLAVSRAAVGTVCTWRINRCHLGRESCLFSQEISWLPCVDLNRRQKGTRQAPRARPHSPVLLRTPWTRDGAPRAAPMPAPPVPGCGEKVMPPPPPLRTQTCPVPRAGTVRGCWVTS